MPLSHYDTHSEEIQEILGYIPLWIVRWGITVILCIFLFIVIGCVFIKFPERVFGTITITSTNVPIDIISNSPGNLAEVFVTNSEQVKTKDILAVISSSANYKDVLYLDKKLNSVSDMTIDSLVFQEWIYHDYDMGEVQEVWSSFVMSCNNYKYYIIRNTTKKRQLLISEQINKQQDYYYQLKEQLLIKNEELLFENKRFKRDSILFSKQIISASNYEESYQRLLNGRSSVMDFEAQILSVELSIIQLKQQIKELTINNEDEILRLTENIMDFHKQILTEINKWKLKYLLIAPIDGYVSFLRMWNKGQYINSDEHFITIVPVNHKYIVGQIEIPQNNIGKVHIGQKVNIKLNGYPFMEYGILKANVAYISAVPRQGAITNNDDKYIVEVLFEDKLTTSYGKDLRLIQKMDGTAEIITDDKRLIMRIIEPIIALFTNGI